MRGYRPDPALVVSACVMHALESLEPEVADDLVIAYLQRLFSRAERAGDRGGLTDRHPLLGSGFGRKRPTVAAPGLGHRERRVRSVGSEKHGIVLFRGPSGKRTCALGMACSGMGPVLGKTPWRVEPSSKPDVM